MEYELTVVTTTYNQEKYIEQCLKSILNQKTDFNFKLLVSDDASNDNTRQILQKYENLFPNKLEVIYREKNLGAMKNFIETLNLVHTKYVALCDGDDFWTDETKLQKQIDFLNKHKEYTICFHQTLIFFEDKSQKSVLHPINIASDLSLQDLIKENFIPANTVVYRWKYQKENSLISELKEDIVPGDYFLHLMHAAIGKIHYIDEQMSCYRRQPYGMWYLSSQLDKQNQFYDIYGEQYLQFFKNVEKVLKLDTDTFKPQKSWIIKESIIAYTKLKRAKKLKKLYKNEYKTNIKIFEETIASFSLNEKIFYYLQTNAIIVLKKGIRFIKWKILKR